MAVYTDVTADDLSEFLKRYDIGELLAYKGIAEGVENSNFLVHTSVRQFHSDALREARRRKRPAVLPRSDGASGVPRHHLSAAGEEPRRRRARQARRPAGGDRHLPRRPMDSPAERRALRGGRRGIGQTASCRRRFPQSAAERIGHRKLAAALQACQRPRRQRAARSVRRDRQGTRRAGKNLAARFAARRDPCRSVSGQRVLPRRQALRA